MNQQGKIYSKLAYLCLWPVLLLTALLLRSTETPSPARLRRITPGITNQVVFQPSELVSTDYRCSESTVLDVNFDEKSKQAILSYTRKDTDGSQSVFLYDPHKRVVLQRLRFRGNQGQCPALGGAFSEDGSHFTVGLVQSIGKPQDLHVFYKTDTGAYEHKKTMHHRPSWLARLSLPWVTPERFVYHEDKDMVACYGDPDVPPTLSLIFGTLWAAIRLYSGFIIPSSTNTVGAKYRIRPAVTIAGQGKCNAIHSSHYFRWHWSLFGIPPGPYASPPTNILTSSNKRWVAYSNATALCILDRLTGAEQSFTGNWTHSRKLVDNDGSIALLQCRCYECFPEKNRPQESRFSLRFSDGGKVHMHRSYCFVTDCHTLDRNHEHFTDGRHRAHAIGAELEVSSANSGQGLQEVGNIDQTTLGSMHRSTMKIPKLKDLEEVVPAQDYTLQTKSANRRQYVLPIIGSSLLITGLLLLNKAGKK